MPHTFLDNDGCFPKMPLGCSRKNPHPPTDGILEILTGGGVEDSGNPGGRGG